jgi:hypothetical protein
MRRYQALALFDEIRVYLWQHTHDYAVYLVCQPGTDDDSDEYVVQLNYSQMAPHTFQTPYEWRQHLSTEWAADQQNRPQPLMAPAPAPGAARGERRKGNRRGTTQLPFAFERRTTPDRRKQQR